MLRIVLGIFCLLPFWAFSQSNDGMKKNTYTPLWAKVDSLTNAGLPESALAATEPILAKAEAEKNYPQLLKALMYKGRFSIETTENGAQTLVNDWQARSLVLPQPARAVLQSMLAEYYSNYAARNYYDMSDRTELAVNPENIDLTTTTLGAIQRRASELYKASLTDAVLKTVPISDFAEILTEAKNTDNLRPTVYDFLAHRALNFFQNERNYLAEPEYKYELTDATAFAPSAIFAQHKFATTDPTAQKYMGLQLFQALTAHHSTNAAALLDVELARLRFVNQNFVGENKKDLFAQALEKLAEKYANTTGYAEIVNEIVLSMTADAQKYEPLVDSPQNTIYKNKYKEAIGLLDRAMRTDAASYGHDLCVAQKMSILQKNMLLSIEKHNPIAKPILFKIDYKNLQKAFFRVVMYDEATRERIGKIVAEKNKTIYSDAYFTQELAALPVLHEGSFGLPDDGDYQQHSTENMLPNLQSGAYMLLLADRSDFKTGALNYADFQVTNLTYFKTDEGGSTNIWLADRLAGAPIAGANVEVFERIYNPKTYSYENKPYKTLVTDKNGQVSVDLIKKTFAFNITKGKDKIKSEAESYNYYEKSSFTPQKTVAFFTDRAIYRPGQTVYYKVLCTIDDKNGVPSIVAKEKITLRLRNTNSEEVAKQELVTNDFGTANGSFTAPAGGLLGVMYLDAEGMGNKYIQVEEYKRPKFEIAFDTLKGNYRLNEKVSVQGFAKAFAGNAIDNATVKYTVKRNAQFPYFDYWSPFRRPFYNTSSQQIANGTLTTDAEGKFTVTFDALPDAKIPLSDKPTFTYTVQVDVIDGNGEQHSASVGTTMGYTSLVLGINTPTEMDRTKPQTLTLVTNNLNGVHLPTKGKLVLYPLEMPTTTYKARLWARPDKPILQKADFQKAFPTLPFTNEDEKTTWAKGTPLITLDFDTKNAKKIAFPSLNAYKPGTYLLVATATDASGETIETKTSINIFNPKDTKPALPITADLKPDKTTYAPGETAELRLASSSKTAYAFIQIIHQQTIIRAEWVPLSNSIATLKIPITEAYRGGLNYRALLFSDNRVYKFANLLPVPWANKDLTVEYATFRDKLLPGQDEEWRVTIKGDKKDKVLAEVLATMYDASLDEFAANDFTKIEFPTDYLHNSLDPLDNEPIAGRLYMPNDWQPTFQGTKQKNYRSQNWFNLFSAYHNNVRRMVAMSMTSRKMDDRVADSAGAPPPPPAPASLASAVGALSETNSQFMSRDTDGDADLLDTKPNLLHTPKEQQSPPTVRTNLKETVFFYPNLMTDAEGNVLIKFKMNEALTRWKFLLFAHTQTLQMAVSTKSIITQKDLMVQPNLPRFLRAGDDIELLSKVVNLATASAKGTATLELENAVTGAPITTFGALAPQSFTAAAGQSALVKWSLRIPENFTDAVTWRIIAKTENASDGEENALPTLTNRQLVTETMPLPIRSLQNKKFTFEAMKKATESNTLTHQNFVLEFTPNPAWYAVQALPYMMEYPYECTEQLFSRIYANTLASTIVKKQPQIEKVFAAWRNTDALESNLSKNQELKSALLAETPWVLDAKNEAQQRKNIALLFDLNKMANERTAAFDKIKQRQLSNGGFAWFTGGEDNWYITQYLVEGFGHLNKLNALELAADTELKTMLDRAVVYCDNKIAKDYSDLQERVKAGKAKLEDDNLAAIHVQYMYARSFFSNIELAANCKDALTYYESQAERFWTKRSDYEQGMLALAMHRKSSTRTSASIAKSLKERALKNEEMGMYWKYPSGYWWYQAPIETHALMIEVFSEVVTDENTVDDLKTWLLKNKQTTAWHSTKSTAAAIYALLVGKGENLLSQNNMPDIIVGNYTIKANTTAAPNVKVVTPEAGSGYFKLNFDKNEINPSFANISVKNNNKVVAWGAAYWQYFEQMDKIKSFVDTPLKLKKELYTTENTAEGKKLLAVAANKTLKVGDKVTMRVVLTADRDMEFVHLKDGRAATMEPTSTVSGYKYQGGLGYYEETRDAATNFFFDYLPKGTYVFEYTLTIQHRGEFSCGIATIQSMYAPEFTSHTEGIRIKVD